MSETKTPEQTTEDWLFDAAPSVIGTLEPSEIKEVEESVAALLRQRDEEHYAEVKRLLDGIKRGVASRLLPGRERKENR